MVLASILLAISDAEMLLMFIYRNRSMPAWPTSKTSPGCPRHSARFEKDISQPITLQYQDYELSAEIILTRFKEAFIGLARDRELYTQS